MGIMGSYAGADPEDIVCAGCGAPLLNLKTTCLRCGGSAKSLKVIQTEVGAPPRQTLPEEPHYMANLGDAVLGQLMLFTAGLGVLFSLINPFISGFSGADLFRSFIALAVSVALLGFKSLLSRP